MIDIEGDNRAFLSGFLRKNRTKYCRILKFGGERRKGDSVVVGLCRVRVSVRASPIPSHRTADYGGRRNTGKRNRRRGIVGKRRHFDLIALTRVLIATSL